MSALLKFKRVRFSNRVSLICRDDLMLSCLDILSNQIGSQTASLRRTETILILLDEKEVTLWGASGCLNDAVLTPRLPCTLGQSSPS